MNIGPQSASDNKFTKKCRLLQSEYRVNILEQDYGVGPYHNSLNRYGNMLVNGKNTGLNFISKAAFQLARGLVSIETKYTDLLGSNSSAQSWEFRHTLSKITTIFHFGKKYNYQQKTGL